MRGTTRDVWTVKRVHVTPADSIGGATDGAKAIVLDVTGIDGGTVEMALMLPLAAQVFHAIGDAIGQCYDQSPRDVQDEIDAIDEEAMKSTDEYDCD